MKIVNNFAASQTRGNKHFQRATFVLQKICINKRRFKLKPMSGFLYISQKLDFNLLQILVLYFNKPAFFCPPSS